MSVSSVGEAEPGLCPIDSYMAEHPDQTAGNFFDELGGDEARYEVAAARTKQEIGLAVSSEALALNAIWCALKARDAQINQT